MSVDLVRLAGAWRHAAALSANLPAKSLARHGLHVTQIQMRLAEVATHAEADPDERIRVQMHASLLIATWTARELLSINAFGLDTKGKTRRPNATQARRAAASLHRALTPITNALLDKDVQVGGPLHYYRDVADQLDALGKHPESEVSATAGRLAAGFYHAVNGRGPLNVWLESVAALARRDVIERSPLWLALHKNGEELARAMAASADDVPLPQLRGA